jgi:hypothetical protein
VLAACSTASPGSVGDTAPLAAELVRRGVPIVAAMAGDVSERACRLYTRRLLTALQNGEPLAEASAHGRRAALLDAELTDDRLDWALPALFVAESVPAGFRAVDPEPTERLLNAAGVLGLRVKPIFIERPGVLDPIDRLFTQPLRVVVYGNERSIAGLGGTRLLREAAFRLLCAGHVPLLLGPYAPSKEPADLPAIVEELFQRAVLTGQALGLRSEHVIALFDPLRGYRIGAEDLEAVAVRARLAVAIAGLARLVADLAGPFGEHTRVVVLADELHHWPGAEALLDLVERGGLGIDPPVPLVATASLADESSVKGFREEHQNRFDHWFPALSTLAPAEARLGFEWVLLHPFLDKYPDTYTRSPQGSPEVIARSLDENGDKPTAVVAPMFYAIARVLALTGHFTSGDDEAAFRAYEERHR